MEKSKIKIGFLIYTHNRLDDAKINMEIVRNYWENRGAFGKIPIVHAYNGKKNWYSKKYLENELIRKKNPGHFQGASELIDAGMDRFLKKYPKIDYVVVVASDTWLINPKYVKNILDKMRTGSKSWATCPWGLPDRNEILDVGAAVDFFILDLKWAKKFKMFPLDYSNFNKKYGELLLYHKGGNVMLEKLIYARYLSAIYNQRQDDNATRHYGLKQLFKITDREPVHSGRDADGFWIRKSYWQKMGLVTHHDPKPKRQILKKLGITNGKNISKLLNSKDLSFYNNGLTGQYNLK